jgi:Tfp pilus assembly protein PilE
MKITRCFNNYAGSALIELLMVFVIIGALASIAIPHYADYRVKALEAQCQANRYHIEMEEMAYFGEHGKPSLKINDKYSCPYGGTYVWLVMDSENVGSENRMDYTVIGDTVNTAAKLQQIVEGGEIIVGEQNLPVNTG